MADSSAIAEALPSVWYNSARGWELWQGGPMKWTIAQQRRYRAQVKALGLTDEERRDLLRRLTGKDSTTALSADEMALVINEQERMLGHEVAVSAHATQDDMVHSLEHRLGWDDNPHRLAGFIHRQTHGKKASLAELDRLEKIALIEALKGVRMHQRRERSLPNDKPQQPTLPE